MGSRVADLLEARKTKEHYTFQQWLGFLDGAALTVRFKWRYGTMTGDEFWIDYYNDGYTPMEALIEDLSYAQ